MWHANEASSHHTSFGRTFGITNTRMPPLQICGHWSLQSKTKIQCSLKYPSTASRYDPINRSIEEERRVQVLVRDNNVDQAHKVLKKKMQREGIFREMKLRGHSEKPSEKRVREKAEAIRRARK